MPKDKIVYIVSKNQYSDYQIVAIKSNREAAEILMKKCSTCHGTEKDPHFNEFDCYDCIEYKRPGNNWNDIEPWILEDA